MNKKLNDDEYHAFLQMFDRTSVQIRRLATQSKIFRVSFRFVNIYAICFIGVFVFMKRFFADAINQDIITEGYLAVLSARANITIWLLVGFNIAYYFNFYFRFFVVLMLMYLLNATIDQTLLFSVHYDYAEKPILAAFYFTRPLLIFALLVTLFKYDEQR